MGDKPYSESALASELDSLKGTNIYLWLQEMLRVNAKLQINTRDDVQFRWNQGQAQSLNTIVSAIDSAAEKAWNEKELARTRAANRKLHQNIF